MGCESEAVAQFRESLAVALLLATGLHMYLLYIDDHSDFAYRELFVPGASRWRPLAVARGVMALHMLFIVTASLHIKKWISQNARRTIHFASFCTFLAATLHGVSSGTDTGHPVMIGTYLGTPVVVAMLVLVRVGRATAPPSPTRLEPAVRARTEKPAPEPETVS